MIAIATSAIAAEVAVPTVQPVVAEDHLNPEDSIYSGIVSVAPGYDRALFASFEDAFREDVVVRAIVEPSFQTEFAVGLKKTGEAYRVFYQEVSEQLWQYSVLDMMKKGEISSSQNGKSTTADEIAKLEKSLPADPKDVKVNRCERGIDPSVGSEIVPFGKRCFLKRAIQRMRASGWMVPFFISRASSAISGWQRRPGVPTMQRKLACSRTWLTR
jgi:hypothetical protein